jgi:hypothetical protein
MRQYSLSLCRPVAAAAAAVEIHLVALAVLRAAMVVIEV